MIRRGHRPHIGNKVLKRFLPPLADTNAPLLHRGGTWPLLGCNIGPTSPSTVNTWGFQPRRVYECEQKSFHAASICTIGLILVLDYLQTLLFRFHNRINIASGLLCWKNYKYARGLLIVQNVDQLDFEMPRSILFVVRFLWLKL